MVDWKFSLGTVGVAKNMFPAKFNFNINSTILAANCTSDFVVYGLNVAGVTGTAAGQANLVVLNNLYSSSPGQIPAGFCTSTGPTVKWAYNASTCGGKNLTSSVFLPDCS